MEQEQRLAVRVPGRVVDELREIATRDANPLSATVRRLLTAAIADERARERATEQRDHSRW